MRHTHTTIHGTVPVRRCITACGAALLALALVGSASGRDLLVANVTMSENGVASQGLFQGLYEGGALTGSIYAGDVILDVAGTVSEAGAISAVLQTHTGEDIGSFSGSIANGVLSGSYTLIGGGSGQVAAPAEKLSAAVEQQ